MNLFKTIMEVIGVIASIYVVLMLIHWVVMGNRPDDDDDYGV